jgi:3-oxoacyl-[acyl-carrier-protein] synthase-1
MQLSPAVPGTVALSAMGAATSLGALVQAAAAARAGIVCARELLCHCLDEDTREPVPLVGHTAGPMTEGFEGLGRLVQLCVAAMEDLHASAPSWQQERLECFLCLPRDLGLGTAPPRSPLEVAQRLMERLREETGLSPRPQSLHILMEERGGTMRALAESIRLLRERQCDHALVLACDSLVSPERTEPLLGARRLKTPDHPVGFMPGEAAVAVLLERHDTLRERGQRSHAHLFEPVTAQEPQCFNAKAPPMGRALVEVLTKALVQAGAGALPEGSVYLDLNGEDFRAHEWGQTRVRARDTCRIDDWFPCLPALSFGETGTASPLLGLCLAARAFARGYGRGHHALLLVSADDGHRAGMVLGRVSDETGGTT